MQHALRAAESEPTCPAPARGLRTSGMTFEHAVAAVVAAALFAYLAYALVRAERF